MAINVKKPRFIIFSSCITSIFLTVILTENILQKQYQYLKSFFLQNNYFLSKLLNDRRPQTFPSNCEPLLIKKIPYGSGVIIGHAYGSPYKSKERGNSGIAPVVNRFLLQHKDNISTLFLTGDVFHTPSLSQWDSFYKEFESSFSIFIAPGNHDVGWLKNNTKRDIFNIYVSNKQPVKMPFLVKNNGFDIVIDDSSIDNVNYLNEISKTIKLIENKEKLLVLRHHVNFSGLSKYANTYADMPMIHMNKNSKKDLETSLNSFKDVSFIYGDGGAFSKLPRIFCSRHSNIRHIISGIGEVKGDKILVLHDKNIYQYVID